jgi:hypothetical protein
MTSVYETYADILGDDLSIQPRAPAYVECTDECKQRRAEWIQASAEYLGKWTKVCRECRGKGGHVYHDDPGDRRCSLPGGTMPFVEYCEHCFERGVCPRCARFAWPDDAFEEETLTCPHCGWTEGNPEHALPDEPECVCYEAYLP